MTYADPSAPQVPMQPASTAVLWAGHSEDLTSMASGGKIASASYSLTEDAIKFEAGLLSKTAETLPLWAVLDVDLKQSLTQRARGVGDLTLRVDPSGYKYGQTVVVLKSIRDAAQVRDLIARQANAVRAAIQQRQHELEIQRRQASAAHTNIGAVPAPALAAPPAGDDLLEKITRLAALHQSGALSADEFAAAKAKLLA
jgi:hypothetical protein